MPTYHRRHLLKLAGTGVAAGLAGGRLLNMSHAQAAPTAQAVTSGPMHHFFGYYDHDQFDATDRLLLATEIGFIDRPPQPDDAVTLGMVDLQGGNRWVPLAVTHAWCWQQDSMMQWLGSAPDRLVIYNARAGDTFCAVVRDVQRGETRTLSRPVYAASPDGKLGVSLNFARLAVTRPGYGYVGLPDPWHDVSHPDDDGLYIVDLQTGDSRLIISYAQIVGIRHEAGMEGTKHWFNHLLFSPDGRRFISLHRWRPPGAAGWKTRMFTANADGSDIHVVADHDMVSHFIWRDATHILAWSREPETGDHFHLYTDQTDEVQVVGDGLLTVDGHCSYSPDKRWILTDTYPDRERNRRLLLFRVADQKVIELGRFYAPRELDGEIRCDLHPRWNRAGTHVCIDSVHENQRQVYLLDVSDIVRQPP